MLYGRQVEFNDLIKIDLWLIEYSVDNILSE